MYCKLITSRCKQFWIGSKLPKWAEDMDVWGDA